MHHSFSKILSPQHSHECLRRLVDTSGFIHAIHDLFAQQKLSDALEEVGKVLIMEIRYDKVTHSEALADDIQQVFDTIWLAGIVLGDHTTGNDPSKVVQVIQSRLQLGPSDILEVFFFFLRQRQRQCRRKVLDSSVRLVAYLC